MNNDGAAPSPAPGRAAFIFIFITVVLDMLALGIVVPVLPKLIKQFEGGDSASAAQLTGWMGMLWAAMQFVFSPVIGAISDRFGRRPVVLISNLGLGLDYVMLALAPTVGWLFVGRAISGLTAASFATASAYIADVTPAKDRAAKFGMLGAAFGLGFVIGPAVGGLLGGIDLRLPFWVASGLSLVNFFYGLLVLPESLPRDRRSVFSLKKANPLGSLRFLRTSPVLMGLGISVLLSSLAHEALPSLFVLYTDYRFHWSEEMVGVSLATVGVLTTVVSAGLVRPMVRALGENRALVFGLGCGAVEFLCIAIAPWSWVVYLGLPFGALAGISSPAMQALLSRAVDAREQGQLQGVVQSLRGLSGMVGPVLYTQLFAATLTFLPGAAYGLASVLITASLLVAVVVGRRVPVAPLTTQAPAA